MKGYRIGVVEYLNAKPLVSGLTDAEFMQSSNIYYATPVELYESLSAGDLDLALLSSITLNKLNNAYAVGNYGIASINYVASVGIFSQVPLAQVKRIFLDKNSLSSVSLLKILLNNYYVSKYNNIQKLICVSSDQILAPDDAILIIGDKALYARANFTYYYDLCAAWHEWTELPFVFARWIACKPIDSEFIQSFDDFQRKNLTNLSKIISLIPQPHPCDLATYYSKHIYYFIDNEMNLGLQRFLAEAKKEL